MLKTCPGSFPSHLAWPRNASGTKFRVNCIFFQLHVFTRCEPHFRTRHGPHSLCWRPIVAHGGSWACLQHANFIEQFRRGAQAATSRPGHDRAIWALKWNLIHFFACTSLSRSIWCYVTFCKVSASHLAWARQPSETKFRVNFKYFEFHIKYQIWAQFRMWHSLHPFSNILQWFGKLHGHVCSMLSL